MNSVTSLHIIYASTSGHTEYVVDTLMAYLKEKAANLEITKQAAEQASPGDLLRGNLLILASGTWNTGGVEGQMNPHMHEFLLKRAATADLKGRRVSIIALGDERYYYTSRAGEHLRSFVQSHGGVIAGDPLVVVNEPYGQEIRIHKWGSQLVSLLPQSL